MSVANTLATKLIGCLILDQPVGVDSLLMLKDALVVKYGVGTRVYLMGSQWRGQTGEIVGTDRSESPPYEDFYDVRLDSGETVFVAAPNCIAESTAQRLGKL